MILILILATWLTKAEIFGPLNDRLQSGSDNLRTTLFFPVLTPQRRLTLALATFALGMVMFALFYGLIVACDRL